MIIKFKITASEDILTKEKVYQLSDTLDKEIFYVASNSINANIAIQELSQFFCKKSHLKNSISISTEWGGETWGAAQLIGTTVSDCNEVIDMKLTSNTFLIFEDGRVWLNANFYTL